VVVLIQNGLDGEDILADFVHPERIFGGLAFICSSKSGPGLINHEDYGSLRIGGYNPDGIPRGTSLRLKKLIADFTRAGIETSPAEDLLLARWEKLAWNIPFSGLSVLLDTDTRKLVCDPDSATLVNAIIRDVALAAKACGKLIEDSFLRKMFDNTVHMVAYAPSIKLDYDAGRPMETEAIFGNPLRASQKAGYEAKYIEMIYHQLKFMERNRKRT
jgi:2-dehydropantoate 2-reductase